jgi:hypothetical protein
MMRTNIGSAVVIAMLLGIAGTANAGVVYDNGGPDTHTGLPIKNWTTADDYTLGAGAAIQSVGFYMQADNGIAGWSKSVSYSFMSDAGGVPGAVLASGAAQNVVETDSGLPWCCNSEHAYLVNFDLQNSFTANAGTVYWLQLSGATGSAANVYWVTTAGGVGTNPAFYEGQNSGGFQVAFNLSGTTLGAQTPEPTGITLAGLGCVTLALVRRRLVRQV